MSEVVLTNVTKSWGDNVAVNDVSFTAERGKLLVLLGPSGCGKSTTLRLIVGLEDVTSGIVCISGRVRQTFKTVPKELEEAARAEGASPLQILSKVYVPLARPVYVAYGLVSVSYHWNNFLWPLVITNSVETRPLTVGLTIFAAPESGVDWSIITAGTLLAVAPLLIAFLMFQRPFVQSFMRAGVE